MTADGADTTPDAATGADTTPDAATGADTTPDAATGADARWSSFGERIAEAERPRGRLAGLRREYREAGLDRAALADDPLVVFRAWIDDAIAVGVLEPNAMTLATVDRSGAPSARVVLLKDVDDGFVFFTNYHSRKARDLAADPRAAAVFNWLDLARQVRVEGTCVRIAAARSDAYWATRPVGSRLGSAASPQSTVIADLSEVEAQAARLAEEHPDGDVPRPDHWGGYRLVPHAVEFWQGRPDRMHQRFLYRRAGGRWEIDQLAP